ncbi:glycosyltransferase family 4 protein [Shewanella frigidimarina]|uniref:glycosyltransferase family 4 protein n=1 Tax=Shewanella frigidimarina TaxID=56812 RepID=UPI003D796136
MAGNKLIIVGTHSTETRGGINAAILAYEQGFAQQNIEFIRVNSHSDLRSRLLTWLKAWFQILQLSLKYRSQAVFWFHCGPWFSLTRKWSFAIIARLFGCQTVAHMHSPTLHNYMAHQYGQYLLKLFFVPFDRVIALTPWWKAQLILFSLNKPIDVCANPVAEEILSAAKLALVTPKVQCERKDTIVILSMARLMAGKGVEHVIDAMVILPERYHLKIAGEGPLKHQLIKQVALLNLQNRVTFVGWVDNTLKHNLLQSVDIFCLPSRYDSFGVVFIEAMAFDLPIVACNWGPIADVVTPDVGLLVPYGEPQSIADTVEKFVETYGDYHLNGPKRVISSFSSSVCCKSVLKLFDLEDNKF